MSFTFASMRRSIGYGPAMSRKEKGHLLTAIKPSQYPPLGLERILAGYPGRFSAKCSRAPVFGPLRKYLQNED